jgi:hypothetical protein
VNGEQNDEADLLRRALPMLIALGDFIRNGRIDPNRPGSLGERCDLILDIRRCLERHCLRCQKDLTDVMGVYVFVGGKPVDGLLCVEHGSNGANNLSHSEYERLTEKE